MGWVDKEESLSRRVAEQDFGVGPPSVAQLSPTERLPYRNDGDPVGEQIAMQPFEGPKGSPSGWDPVLPEVVRDPPREGGPIGDTAHD